ncbi:MAG: ABC transporter permease, partial [Spirochaetia bacterium]
MYRENSAPDFLRKTLATKWIWSYVGALVVYIIISLVSSNSVTTLIVSATFASFFIMVGLGQMLVITLGAGNIDLSIPYTIGLSGLMAMKVMNGTDGMIWLGILAGLGSGAIIGAFNFLLISFVRIPPMIATLSSGFIIQTLAIVFFRGLQIKPPDGLQTFVNVKFGPIPLIFLVVIAIVYIMHLVITRSKYGRFIHAIGQNIRAASLAGINI